MFAFGGKANTSRTLLPFFEWPKRARLCRVGAVFVPLGDWVVIRRRSAITFLMK